MSQGGHRESDLWVAFVEGGIRSSADLEHRLGAIDPNAVGTPAVRSMLAALADKAFSLAVQSLLMGAEDIGQLALACERCLEFLGDGTAAVDPGYPILVASLDTLRQAFEALAVPDLSGSRVDTLPLRAARYEIETLFPVPGKGTSAVTAPDVPVAALTRKIRVDTAPAASDADGSTDQPAAVALLATAAPHLESAPVAVDSPGDAHGSAVAASAVWTPTVDSDMVELFFEEADERIEDLSMKLLNMEQQPDDMDIVRDVFRDLHTLKGSAAMVGLEPMNQLAHAAEDLVGQVRDGTRGVDSAIIDALLATLDGLRDIATLARKRQVISADLRPILERLREPHALPDSAAHPDPGGAAAGAVAAISGGAEAALPAQAAAETETGSLATADGDRGQGASEAQRARPTIRVDFDKLDRLMNLVGELILGRDELNSVIQSLTAINDEFASSRWGGGDARRKHRARDVLATVQSEMRRIERVLIDIAHDADSATGRLDSISAALRDQVMKLRMVPVGGVFRKHRRTVRDLAGALGKRIRLDIAGEDTELDKVLIESLDEPLMHLVRNAVDHGIESADVRQAAGKPAEGVIHLSAAHRGSQVIIRIADDGKGLDPEALRVRARTRGLLSETELAALDDRDLFEIIFRPGFSTAATVSAVSGRGVGMDVVRDAIVERLKGMIDIESTPGRGTAFTLRLPLTLAIIQVLLARAGGEVFAVPLDTVVRTLACDPAQIRRVQEREVIEFQGRYVPLVRLDEVLGLERDPYAAPGQLQIILTDLGSSRFGLVCEHLLGKRESVIKSLGPLLQHVPGTAGATLLGDRCVLILDVPVVIQRALRLGSRSERYAPVTAANAVDSEPAEVAPRILLAEDSDTVREALRRMLADAGYRVTAARDGVEALEAAQRQRYDLVSTDVTMPRMDGYELTRALREQLDYKDTPILMVTSRGERIDRVRGFDAGVDEYITKPHDRHQLLGAIRRLLAAGTAERPS